MGTAASWTRETPNGFPSSLQVAEFVLTADADGIDSAYTAEHVVGEVVKVEVDPGTLNPAATIKAYEYGTLLATGTRDHFLDYTVPDPAVEVVFYPLVESSATNANGALTTKVSQRRVSAGQIECDLAGATEDDTVTVRLYVQN